MLVCWSCSTTSPRAGKWLDNGVEALITRIFRTDHQQTTWSIVFQLACPSQTRRLVLYCVPLYTPTRPHCHTHAQLQHNFEVEMHLKRWYSSRRQQLSNRVRLLAKFVHLHCHSSYRTIPRADFTPSCNMPRHAAWVDRAVVVLDCRPQGSQRAECRGERVHHAHFCKRHQQRTRPRIFQLI